MSRLRPQSTRGEKRAHALGRLGDETERHEPLVLAGLQPGLEQNLLSRADAVGPAPARRDALEREPRSIKRLRGGEVADRNVTCAMP